MGLTEDNWKSLLGVEEELLAYSTAFLSGDLCCRHRDNKLLYWMGRRDRQVQYLHGHSIEICVLCSSDGIFKVKVRGVRVELEELERAAVAALPGLLSCDVVALTLTQPDAEETDRRTFLALVVRESALENQLEVVIP